MASHLRDGRDFLSPTFLPPHLRERFPIPRFSTMYSHSGRLSCDDAAAGESETLCKAIAGTAAKKMLGSSIQSTHIPRDAPAPLRVQPAHSPLSVDSPYLCQLLQPANDEQCHLIGGDSMRTKKHTMPRSQYSNNNIHSDDHDDNCEEHLPTCMCHESKPYQ